MMGLETGDALSSSSLPTFQYSSCYPIVHSRSAGDWLVCAIHGRLQDLAFARGSPREGVLPFLEFRCDAGQVSALLGGEAVRMLVEPPHPFTGFGRIAAAEG